jgi:hypothetical protein
MNTFTPDETLIVSGLHVRTEIKAGTPPLCVQAQQAWGKDGREFCEACLDMGANYDLPNNGCWMVL